MGRKARTSRHSEADDAEKVRPIGSSAKQGKRKRQPEKADFERCKPCKYVVAIDFGTAFSGAAFAKVSDLESKNDQLADTVHVHTKWPDQHEAGAVPYCKTLTSVWYMPGPNPGTFEVKGWGWTGYVDYREDLQNACLTVPEMTQPPISDRPVDYITDVVSSINSPRASARHLDQRARKSGHFITKFKLGLAPGHSPNLPDGLTLVRVISDYLRELSTYVLQQLKKLYGSDAESHREIQYVVTVPAIWTPQARQIMKDCAEMAGMVGGPACIDNVAASQHDLIIVTEPEAAAVQVHKTLDATQFRNGDQFLVVDVGGGTTDIVLHEKIGSTTRRNIRVREVSASEGDLVGGSHVDDGFFDFVEEKIGCLKDFKLHNPREILEVCRRWNYAKCSFDGESKRNISIDIPSKLARQWKRYDIKANGRRTIQGYDSLMIPSSEVKSIFDVVVEKIISLIRQQLVPGLTAILVVGGFSESPYLSKRIGEAFEEKTLFMQCGGSAVVRGAVSYGVANEWISMVTTRKSSRTIGYDTAKPFVKGKHREDYLVVDLDDPRHPNMCDNIFGAIVRRGEVVPSNHIHKVTLKPLYRIGREDGDLMELNLYETRARNPMYVTDKGVRKLTTCQIAVPRKECLGRDPKIVLSVHFGTTIRATVEGKNFEGKKVTMAPVEMKWILDNV